jgi:hypothetical protein
MAPSSVVDPDWIRIQWCPGIQEGKITTKKQKGLINFILKYWMFSCSLDVLYGGLGISKMQLLIKKGYIKNFQLYFFYNFL